MEENEHCYHYEERNYSEPLFHEGIDVTYVIHLEGNGRYQTIVQQLEQYPITSRVIILHNQGFKKCEKNAHIRAPAYDLIDAFLQIFKHAYENDYDNILILEDDFIFDEKIRSDFHRENIVEFLKKKSHGEESFLYYLGCVPWLQIPYDSYTYRAGFTGGTHSVIYSKKYRDAVMNYDQVDIGDWDIFNNIGFIGGRYVYYTPLCYQLFPVTENSKSWGGFNGFTQMFGSMLFSIFQLFGMDKSVEPGYSFFYVFSKVLFFILVFLVSFLLYAWIGRGLFLRSIGLVTRNKSGK
jgi:hypothetical protein